VNRPPRFSIIQGDVFIGCKPLSHRDQAEAHAEVAERFAKPISPTQGKCKKTASNLLPAQLTAEF
jgi:hypothetical protein